MASLTPLDDGTVRVTRLGQRSAITGKWARSNPRRIRISSSALGDRCEVVALVYETLEEMRTAAQRYNGNDVSQALAVTQVRTDKEQRVSSVIVRLVRGHLGTQVVVHEMHHASTAWYGAHVGNRISRLAHLNHYNEPFAHLHSDLTHHLVDRLYELGYYEECQS